MCEISQTLLNSKARESKIDEALERPSKIYRLKISIILFLERRLRVIQNNILRSVIVVCLFVLSLSPCHGEDGVSSSTVVLGQSAPFTGPIGRRGSDYRDGANLYFVHV